MNYQILKTILESLLNNFRCPDCESKITDNDLEILATANQSINIEVSCPNCNKKTLVKAEMSSLNLGNIPNLPPEILEKLKQKLKDWINTPTNKKPTHLINEKEIIDLKNTLNQDNLWVDDFLRNI